MAGDRYVHTCTYGGSTPSAMMTIIHCQRGGNYKVSANQEIPEVRQMCDRGSHSRCKYPLLTWHYVGLGAM